LVKNSCKSEFDVRRLFLESDEARALYSCWTGPDASIYTRFIQKITWGKTLRERMLFVVPLCFLDK
jgi:hypothetical protein